MRIASTILFVCTIALLAMGLVVLVSASTGQEESRHLIMQPIWCLVGLGFCGLAVWKDYRFLRNVSWLLLAVAVMLLVAVLIPGFGITIKGASRWLGVGPFRMQPSELAKLALIIALAHYGAHYQRQMPSLWRGLIIPTTIMAPVIGLVFVEPDVGAAALMAAVGGLMLLVAGTRLRYLILPATAAMIALGVYLWQDPMRSSRIHSWLNLEETRYGKGMQAYQSVLAIAKGGLYGVGLGEGRQKLGFIPEHHTDFIFSVIGEELGLAATLPVVLMFMAIVLAGFYIARHARETFGMLLASGISFLIGFQAIINIGVVTAALPNKGLSLPFISYGGSNLIMLMAGIGLLLNVARHGGGRRAQANTPLPSNDSLSYQFS